MDGKEKVTSRSQKLSKSSRLKKKSDFRFTSFKRLKTRHFVLVIAPEGRARLGISLSKRILKSAAARNRVRRLIREVFRKNREAFQGFDVNVLGSDHLTKTWRTLSYIEVEGEILKAMPETKSREIDNDKDF